MKHGKEEDLYIPNGIKAISTFFYDMVFLATSNMLMHLFIGKFKMRKLTRS